MLTSKTSLQLSAQVRGILRRHTEAFVGVVLPLLRQQAEAKIAAALGQSISPSSRVSLGKGERRVRRSDDTGIGRVIENTKRLIEERFRSRELTLDYLARRAGLSKFYLARTFQARVGRPIHYYLVDVRVARARALLEMGKRPTEVWQLAGFADQPHMTRVFRSRLGSTPKAFHLRPGTRRGATTRSRGTGGAWRQREASP